MHHLKIVSSQKVDSLYGSSDAQKTVGIPGRDEEKMERNVTVRHENEIIHDTSDASVIEIPSTDEEEEKGEQQSLGTGRSERLVSNPEGHVDSVRGWLSSQQKNKEPRQTSTPIRKFPSRSTPRSRRTIQSSSESGSDSDSDSLPSPSTLLSPRKQSRHQIPEKILRDAQDVIEISSDTSSDGLHPEIGKRRPSRSAARPIEQSNTLQAEDIYIALPVQKSRDTECSNSSKKPADVEEPWEIDDGSILVLDEGKSSRKPIRRLVPSSSFSSAPINDSRSSLTSKTIASRNIPEGGRPRTDGRTGIASVSGGSSCDPVPQTPAAERRVPSSPVKGKATPSRVTGKKASAASIARDREAYAMALFASLNASVFKDKLPKGTELNWNKRLLSTAGRARWHRSRTGVETAGIELAIKVLDTDERIRNTLAHEMCHLACWIIDGDPKEGHGPAFKSWARKIMRARPDIEVTTKHNYEISYPYQWKCEKCAKIYGRFSKSIRPDDCVCGVCKEGTLIPLFHTRSRAGKPASRKDDDLDTPTTVTSARSRMANGQPQGSPRTTTTGSSPSLWPLTSAGTTKASVEETTCTADGCESGSLYVSDTDVEAISKALQDIQFDKE